MKLWICGRIKSRWRPSGSAWDFQGVFSTEELADKACRDETYFIWYVNLDEELPHESFMPNDYRYPRLEDEKTIKECYWEFTYPDKWNTSCEKTKIGSRPADCCLFCGEIITIEREVKKEKEIEDEEPVDEGRRKATTKFQQDARQANEDGGYICECGHHNADHYDICGCEKCKCLSFAAELPKQEREQWEIRSYSDGILTAFSPDGNKWTRTDYVIGETTFLGYEMPECGKDNLCSSLWGWVVTGKCYLTFESIPWNLKKHAKWVHAVAVWFKVNK